MPNNIAAVQQERPTAFLVVEQAFRLIWHGKAMPRLLKNSLAVQTYLAWQSHAKQRHVISLGMAKPCQGF